MAHEKVKKKLLLVGYERNLAILHGGALQKLAGYEVSAADSAEWGRQLYSSETFDFVVLGSGLTPEERQCLADEIKQANPATKVILLPEAVIPSRMLRFLER